MHTRNPYVLLLSIAALFVACGSAEEQINRRASAAQAANNAPALTPDGMAIFRQYCVLCHGADGKLGLNGAKDLTATTLTLEERINIIAYGKKLMTPFNEILTPEEIKAVAEYTQTLVSKQ
ncbi:MAG: cytochrome c [Saprospiraceae bacterium]|nr:cytochrome c [Saprospiraceae bacterium]